jgi:hypothetical protein
MRLLRRVLVVVGAGALACVLLPISSAQAASTGGGGGGAPAAFFVVGDQSAALAFSEGSAVEFWGAQWAKDNSLSGGSAPASFKGYADSVPTTATGDPVCSGTWTARTGNSSAPPASVSSQIEVIVASSVSQSGSTISGDVAGVLLINTNPGYSGDPGHAGTGTVAAIIC